MNLLYRTFSLTAIWWMLTDGRIDSWPIGAVTVVLALAVSLILIPTAPSRLSLSGLAAFAGFFLGRSLLSGIQVAALAMRARPDLNPAILELPVSLPEGVARVLLANTLTLLPGTLSVGFVGDHLRLHVLDARLPIEGDVRLAEARIARIFG